MEERKDSLQRDYGKSNREAKDLGGGIYISVRWADCRVAAFVDPDVVNIVYSNKKRLVAPVLLGRIPKCV